MRIAALLCVLLCLTGCRDYLAPATPDQGVPAEAPPPSVPSMYVKVPSTSAVGQEVVLRAQAVDGAVAYRWRIVGDGAVLGAATTTRVYDGRTIAAGAVEVQVRAYDAADDLLAYGADTFVIER
jgi:hypothetical protein